MELNSKSFVGKCNDLFQKFKSVSVAMFVFGFAMQRKNGKNERFLIDSMENPIKDELRDLWDEDTWAKIRRGSAYVTPTDEEEADPFPLLGILFVMRQLEKAIELNHPDWGIFYIIGEALGRFNSNEIHQSEFDYFISRLPLNFVKKYREDILFLCNYFDERNKQLVLYIEGERVVAFFVNKQSG